jgi:hypothetical protein
MTKRILSGLCLATLLVAPALAAQLPARTPGLWQSTTTVTGPDGKPLSNAVNVITVSCVDALNDQKFFTSNQSACTGLTVSGQGNNYNIDGSCTGQGLGQSVHIHETLVYGEKALQLQAVYNGAEGAMTVTSQLQWQGDCLAGMQPGDEGSVTGGVFSKSDNINDTGNQ